MRTVLAVKTEGTPQPSTTAAQQAFIASGLDIAYVARVVNLSPTYLKTQLRTGCRCYVTAERLRRVLNCPVEFFLPHPKQNLKPNTKEGGGPPKQTARAKQASQQ